MALLRVPSYDPDLLNAVEGFPYPIFICYDDKLTEPSLYVNSTNETYNGMANIIRMIQNIKSVIMNQVLIIKYPISDTSFIKKIDTYIDLITKSNIIVYIVPTEDSIYSMSDYNITITGQQPIIVKLMEITRV